MRGLEEQLGRAGAVFVQRDGVTVAAHFGSTAAELAVCRHGVGVADASDLATLELRGPGTAVGAVCSRVAGHLPRPGHARQALGAWWCAVTAQRVLVLAPRTAAAALVPELDAAVAATPRASQIDLTGDYAAIDLVGPHAEALARATGLLAVPPEPGLFVAGATRAPGLRPAQLLVTDPQRLLVLVPAAHGPGAWAHLLATGRVHGASCVGRDALDRLRAVGPRAQLA